MRLVIDNREQKVIPYFHKINPIDIELEYRTLPEGDYIVYDLDDNPIIIIERKTWKDLASSFKDGRSANIKKLKRYRDEHNCIALYLIEGKSRPAPKKLFCGIPFKNLQAHLDHLIIRDRISVIYSNNAEDTPNRLVELIKNYSTIKIKPPHGGSNPDSVYLEDEIIDPIVLNMWCELPSVSVKTAEILYKKYHISDVLLRKIDVSEFNSLKYKSGVKIGARCKSLTDLISGKLSDEKIKKIYEKVLASIKGISKPTALLILEKIKFEDILLGKIEQKTIAKIARPKSMKIIGKSIAERIIKYLVKSV